MLRRTFLAASAAAVLAGVGAAAAQQPAELNFGIISTESTTNLKPIWTPFIEDMSKSLGVKVNAFFAPDYAGIVEGMRFNKVQLAWYGNAAAVQAVDRADGEVFVQSVDKDGNPGYWSLLIVHKDSPIQTLKDLVAAPGKYTFSNGDPNSTSGFLVPSYYVFAQNGIDARKHFTRVVNANHETNALSVASKQVDVATNNTENMERFRKTNAERAANVREIWRSPLIPSDPIVWRKDLAPEMKQKVKTFFLTYGTDGRPNAAAEKAVLAGLQWAPFRESSNAQLIPIRQLAFFRDKLKLETDTVLGADEKARRIAEIDQKLAELDRQMPAKVN
jgi:phosphonate transport system substrate-binding protein